LIGIPLLAVALAATGYVLTDWAWRFGVMWQWRQRLRKRRQRHR